MVSVSVGGDIHDTLTQNVVAGSDAQNTIFFEGVSSLSFLAMGKNDGILLISLSRSCLAVIL